MQALSEAMSSSCGLDAVLPPSSSMGSSEPITKLFAWWRPPSFQPSTRLSERVPPFQSVVTRKPARPRVGSEATSATRRLSASVSRPLIVAPAGALGVVVAFVAVVLMSISPVLGFAVRSGARIAGAHEKAPEGAAQWTASHPPVDLWSTPDDDAAMRPSAAPPRKSAAELLGVPVVPRTARDRIVLTAIDLFYDHGFNAVGLDRILEVAGTTKTTFYKHFASKDELVVVAVRERDAWERQ